MTVEELISKLKEFNPKAEVRANVDFGYGESVVDGIYSWGSYGDSEEFRRTKKELLEAPYVVLNLNKYPNEN